MASATYTATRTDMADPSTNPPGLRPAALLTPGWLAALLLLLATAATLHYYDTSARAIAMFTAYSIFAITLPGMSIWRGLLGRSSHISTDLAAGTALGFAIEIPVYPICRTAGVPLAMIAWPAATYLASPSRPGCGGSGADPASGCRSASRSATWSSGSSRS